MPRPTSSWSPRAATASTAPPNSHSRCAIPGVVPPTAQLWAVDADAMFVRPGPRLVDGVEVLAGIAHPDAVEPNRAAATLIARP